MSRVQDLICGRVVNEMIHNKEASFFDIAVKALEMDTKLIGTIHCTLRQLFSALKTLNGCAL